MGYRSEKPIANTSNPHFTEGVVSSFGKEAHQVFAAVIDFPVDAFLTAFVVCA